MAQANFTMRELMEAGVHFGHKTKRWNPRMAPYIFGVRNNLHIIDLRQTVPLLHQALDTVRDVAAKNGRILFVGTKRQASDPVAEAAKRCGQYYVNQRWLGGMLTNWKTIQTSIKRLRSLESLLEQEDTGLTKKELLSLSREQEKLEKSLGGIKTMGGIPDMLFVIDTTLEDLAIQEAKKLGIPVVAICDTNASVEDIAFPVPGNDDATRAIKLYCRLVSDAALEGLQQGMSNSDKDMGESAELPTGEDALVEAAAAEATDGPSVVVKPKRKSAAAKKKDEEASADAEDSKGDAA